MLVDVTSKTIAVLEGGSFEAASKTLYHRPAGVGVPAGRYLIESDVDASIENIISALADRNKRCLNLYPFITDCLSFNVVASFPVNPLAVPVPVHEDGQIAVDGDGVIVRVRSANLKWALRKVTEVSPNFEAAIVRSFRGAQALRLTARDSEASIEIVVWVATHDSFVSWIPKLQ